MTKSLGRSVGVPGEAVVDLAVDELVGVERGVRC